MFQGLVDMSPEELFKLHVLDLVTAPEWNKVIMEAEVLHLNMRSKERSLKKFTMQCYIYDTGCSVHRRTKIFINMHQYVLWLRPFQTDENRCPPMYLTANIINTTLHSEVRLTSVLSLKVKVKS